MKKFVKRVAFIVMAACMAAVGLVGCGEETLAGEFYTLQEAYDKGWLTQDDLLSIAYDYQGREDNEELMGEDYVPQPKTPETLSKQTEKSIKQTLLDKYNKGIEPGSYYYGTIDQVYILGYYGTYNGCVAVKMDAAHYQYDQAIAVINIAGVNFYYNNGNRLKIWRATEDEA